MARRGALTIAIFAASVAAVGGCFSLKADDDLPFAEAGAIDASSKDAAHNSAHDATTRMDRDVLSEASGGDTTVGQDVEDAADIEDVADASDSADGADALGNGTYDGALDAGNASDFYVKLTPPDGGPTYLTIHAARGAGILSSGVIGNSISNVDHGIWMNAFVPSAPASGMDIEQNDLGARRSRRQRREHPGTAAASDVVPSSEAGSLRSALTRWHHGIHAGDRAVAAQSFGSPPHAPSETSLPCRVLRRDERSVPWANSVRARVTTKGTSSSSTSGCTPEERPPRLASTRGGRRGWSLQMVTYGPHTFRRQRFLWKSWCRRETGST